MFDYSFILAPTVPQWDEIPGGLADISLNLCNQTRNEDIKGNYTYVGIILGSFLVSCS